jgi:hypothetical protein
VFRQTQPPGCATIAEVSCISTRRTKQPSFRVQPHILVGFAQVACTIVARQAGERTTKIDVLLCPHYFHVLWACKSLDKNPVVEWFELDWKMHGDLGGCSFEICDNQSDNHRQSRRSPRTYQECSGVYLFVYCEMNEFVSGLDKA